MLEFSNQVMLPDNFCIDIVKDFIAANWDDFVQYANACEVDPDIVYRQIGKEKDLN